jgi:hypothetical protein
MSDGGTLEVGGHKLVLEGGFCRKVSLRQEFYYEITDPLSFLELLRRSGVKADILTFLEKFPVPTPQYSYLAEIESVAAIAITSVDDWLCTLPKQTRRGLRKADESQVKVRWVDFDDDLVSRISSIFNECPIRQGKPFIHYGKDFQTVKEMLGRDIERSRYLGAYIGEELIGFTKLIFGRNFARTTLIMSKVANRQKYPNNALLAKAVEICVLEKIPFLVYGMMEYGKVGNKSLADFKANNGFVSVPLPRYYVPLTIRGKICLQLGLQRGVLAALPKSFLQRLLKVRAWWFARAASVPQKPTDASATE